MIGRCSNPGCNKSLQSLREGTIYVFETNPFMGSPELHAQTMEHFWLCGACSEAFIVEQTGDRGICVVKKTAAGRQAPVQLGSAQAALAS